MSDYRRYLVPGATYFFTLVTERRVPLFQEELARTLLRASIEETRERWPFTIVAWVLLPEHLHAIWTLPPGDQRYALRWSWIKRTFTRNWLAQGGREQGRSFFRISLSRIKEGRRAVWQRRFWEHMIEDEEDFENHFDYIHSGPVKHQLVQRAKDWPWSTFHRYVKSGHYPSYWADGEDLPALPGDAGE